MSKYYILLGNGFSIDYIRHIGLSDSVDVADLFRLGPLVRWPKTDKAGFLSFKYCPNLWSLGARPNMGAHESIRLIEDIISCANAYSISKNRNSTLNFDGDSRRIYLAAYKELTHYLRELFIYYNTKITIGAECHDWSWGKIINKINNDDSISSVTIVTYNYDIILERVLEKHNIKYRIGLDKKTSTKFKVIKPHGSISFRSAKERDRASYSISYDSAINSYETKDIKIDSKNPNSASWDSFIIPPAGESGRLDNNWAKEMREEAISLAEKLEPGDTLIVAGISYWHVDRMEVDRIIASINPDVEVIMINPDPPKAFTAVLTSFFSNLLLFPNASMYEESL